MENSDVIIIYETRKLQERYFYKTNISSSRLSNLIIILYKTIIFIVIIFILYVLMKSSKRSKSYANYF